MKFTYTHITKNYTEITICYVSKDNKLKVKKYVRNIRTLEAV